MQYSTEVLLNDFAIRSFRDPADRDYIHARLAYRHRLVPQFLWSALHCLEKYAKGILLINRVPAKKLGHEVSGAIERIRDYAKFEVKLSEAVIEFINRLETGAEFRYFEVSYWNEPYDVVRLDCAVSELRRYCQVLDFEIRSESGITNPLQPMLQRIEFASKSAIKDSCISNGLLESILKDKKHPSRKALVWQNLYFSNSSRSKVKLDSFWEAGNAPLFIHPDLIDQVVKYVRFPQKVEKSYRQLISNSSKND
jgi:hypothetical protein